MNVWLWGVGGTTDDPGNEAVDEAVGRPTSCLAIGDDQARLVLDAGSGLAGLTGPPDPEPFQGTILLTHLHSGHTRGLAPFAATVGARAGARIDLLVPRPDGGGASTAPAPLPAWPRWRMAELTAGDHRIEGYQVRARPLPHCDLPTFGFRVTDPDTGRSVAYLPDHGPLAAGPGPLGLGALHHDAVELAYGADLLVHGAMFADHELGAAAARGHATTGYAVGLANRCRVGRLVLIHHHPLRSEAGIEALTAAAAVGAVMAVSAGRAGDRYDLGSAPAGAGPGNVTSS